MSEDYLSVAEAAEKLSVSPRTIQRYCKQGRLNHKWVTGKRHKELRIIPPLPIMDLPGVKQKNVLDASDYVTKVDFENITGELKSLLTEKEKRIEELENEIQRLQSAISGSPQPPVTAETSQPHDSDFLKKAQEFLHDFKTVRPVEKRLIIKMAKEVQAHSEFLRSLGMESPEHDDSMT